MRGLALLLGWTGGARKHVRKHEAIYRAHSWRALTATVSIDDTFLPRHLTALQSTAEAVLAEIDAHAASSARIDCALTTRPADAPPRARSANLSPPSEQSLTAAHLLDTSPDLSPPLLIPHCFSNGGVILLLQIIERARAAGRPLHFDAIVFDSAPSPLHHLQASLTPRLSLTPFLSLTPCLSRFSLTPFAPIVSHHTLHVSLTPFPPIVSHPMLPICHAA